jgi:peptidyl-tRNA hydrolase, PTH1 family
MIVFGLGNNEDKYLQTRHNAGRLVVEKLAENFSLKQNYFYSKSDDNIFLYSAGYMNESGSPIENLCKYFKLENQLLLVIHDDSDQFEGSFKMIQGGGSGGHNGITSIYKHILNTNIDIENVWRIKIGIRPLGNSQKSENFVLKPISTEIANSVQKISEILMVENSFADFVKLQHNINSK